MLCSFSPSCNGKDMNGLLQRTLLLSTVGHNIQTTKKKICIYTFCTILLQPFPLFYLFIFKQGPLSLLPSKNSKYNLQGFMNLCDEKVIMHSHKELEVNKSRCSSELKVTLPDCYKCFITADTKLGIVTVSHAWLSTCKCSSICTY